MDKLYTMSICFLMLLFIPICATSNREERFVTLKTREKLVHLAKDVYGAVRCRVVLAKDVVLKILESVKDKNLQELDPESMKLLMEMCKGVEIPYHLKQLFPFGNKSIVFPGTKWCGASNTADDYDDLGEFWETDMCCRTHDHCPDYIEVGQEKYGLVNKNLGTVSLCSCDDKFYNCLKDSNHVVSTKIGNVYFNILGMPCFDFKHPIAGCNRWGGFGNSQCQEYVFNETLPEKWQFFDAKEY